MIVPPNNIKIMKYDIEMKEIIQTENTKIKHCKNWKDGFQVHLENIDNFI